MSDTPSSTRSNNSLSWAIFGRSPDAKDQTSTLHLLSTSIPLVEVVIDDHNKAAAVYSIEVCTKFNKYRIGRRYTDFFQLFTLLKTIPGYTFSNFPPKTWFTSLNTRFLQQRKTQLESFLVHAVAFAQEHNLRIVLDFIEFTKLTALRNLVNREPGEKGEKTPSTWDRLETYLFKLNLESDNRLAILKDLHVFLLTEANLVRSCSLKQLIVGDKSLPGLLQMFCMNSERNPLVDVEFLRVFVSMLNITAFKHAPQVRQLVLSLRAEDICKWPIFEYLRGASTKKEASSLLFEFVKIYEEINPSVNLQILFKSEIALKRYRSWAKVAFSQGCGYSHGEFTPTLVCS